MNVCSNAITIVSASEFLCIWSYTSGLATLGRYALHVSCVFHGDTDGFSLQVYMFHTKDTLLVALLLALLIAWHSFDWLQL